jgi:hypothetical protein
MPAKPHASPVAPACGCSHCFSAAPPVFVQNPDHCKTAACLRRLTQSITVFRLQRLSFTPFFLFFSSRVSSPTHKIFLMLSTMSRRRKSSNCSTLALLEVKHVFKSTTGPSLISLVSNLNHALNEKDDQEGDAAAKKHWGDLTDCELVCALLQLRLLFKWARGCMSLRHAAEAEGRRGLARRLACRHRRTN